MSTDDTKYAAGRVVPDQEEGAKLSKTKLGEMTKQQLIDKVLSLGHQEDFGVPDETSPYEVGDDGKPAPLWHREEDGTFRCRFCGVAYRARFGHQAGCRGVHGDVKQRIAEADRRQREINREPGLENTL